MPPFWMQTWTHWIKFFDTLCNIVGIIDEISVMICFNSLTFAGLLWKTLYLRWPHTEKKTKTNGVRSGDLDDQMSIEVKWSSKNSLSTSIWRVWSDSVQLKTAVMILISSEAIKAWIMSKYTSELMVLVKKKEKWFYYFLHWECTP